MNPSSLVRLLQSSSDTEGILLGMTLREMVDSRKDDIGLLADRYGISNVRIFGSVARGDPHPGSDVDFLVDVPPGVSLYDLSRFRRELAELLGVDVDVVSSRALLPRDHDVLEEAIGL